LRNLFIFINLFCLFQRPLLQVYRPYTSLHNQQFPLLHQQNQLGVHVEHTVCHLHEKNNNIQYGVSLALAEDQLRLVHTIISGDENESFGSIGDQPITRKDIRTLRGLTWLNDEVRKIIFNLLQRFIII